MKEKLIVVRDITNNGLYILNKDLYKEMKIKDVYNQYGNKDCPSELEDEVVTGYTYWDGSNFQTKLLRTDDDYYGDLEPADEDEEKEILEHLRKAEFEDKGIFGTEGKTEKYIFADLSCYEKANWFEYTVEFRD